MKPAAAGPSATATLNIQFQRWKLRRRRRLRRPDGRAGPYLAANHAGRWTSLPTHDTWPAALAAERPRRPPGHSATAAQAGKWGAGGGGRPARRMRPPRDASQVRQMAATAPTVGKLRKSAKSDLIWPSLVSTNMHNARRLPSLAALWLKLELTNCIFLNLSL